MKTSCHSYTVKHFVILSYSTQVGKCPGPFGAVSPYLVKSPLKSCCFGVKNRPRRWTLLEVVLSPHCSAFCLATRLEEVEQ